MSDCTQVEPAQFFDYIFEQEAIFIVGAIIIFIFTTLAVFDVIWTRLQIGRHASSEIRANAESLGVSIMKHFLPSLAVDAYRFRGMSEKLWSIHLKFVDLGLRLSDGRTPLEHVSGEFRPGRLAGILGPSGAGKTTLLNVLCGKATYGTVSGEVLINDGEVDMDTLRPEMGFVPQDDVVHEQLSVRENLHFSALLRNPADTSIERIDAIVDDVLNVLQLRHIQSSRVGSVEARGISGGQRKRVNIGLELAACPALLFLDEPTSGLDATSSLQIINSLGKMTRLNMTIVMVIHQPRYGLFTLLDDVVLLGRGGGVVYQGPSVEAKAYFEGLGYCMPENDNPADWFMDILAGAVETPAQLEGPEEASDLVRLWTQHQTQQGEKRPSAPRRAKTLGDHKTELGARVTNYWHSRGPRHLEKFAKQDLQALLARLSLKEVSDEALDDVMKRIAEDGESATLKEFSDYLEGLLNGIASDKATVTGAPNAFDLVRAIDSLSSYFAAQMNTAVDEMLPSRTAIQRCWLFVNCRGNLLSKCCFLLGRKRRRGLSSSQIIFAPRARPGPAQQLGIQASTRLVQFFREWKLRFLDNTLIAILAFGLGIIQGETNVANQSSFSSNLLFFFLGIALLISTSALKLFRNDRALFWRERARGVNVLSFAAGRVLISWADVLLQTYIYVLVYYSLVRPFEASFLEYFWPALLVALAAAGWGNLASIVLPPNSSTIGVVLVILLFTGILGDPLQLDDLADGSGRDAIILLPSLSRWAIPMPLNEALTRWEEAGYTCVSLTTKNLNDQYKSATQILTTDSWEQGVGILLLTVLVLFFASYLALRFMHRGKVI